MEFVITVNTQGGKEMARKHAKIIENKQKGDRWYTVNAPEELRLWHKGNPWESDALREYGVSLVMAEPMCSKTLSRADSTEYTKKKPLTLKSGTRVVSGYTTQTSNALNGRYELFPKDMPAFRSDMMELTRKHLDVTKFWLNRLTVYNIETGYTLFFEYFNPDGTGDVLALWEVENDEGRINFSEIADKSTLDLMVGGFREQLVGCVAVKPKADPTKLVPKCNVISHEEFERLKKLEEVEGKEKIIKAKDPVTKKKEPEKAPNTRLRKGAAMAAKPR